MNKILSLAILCCSFSFCAFAQPHDLVSSSGSTFQNSSGYISFSVGEPVISTFRSTTTILSQGFHQTRLRSGVPVLSQPEIQMTVFPNPVKDKLILVIENPLQFEYQVHDTGGRMIFRGKIIGERTEIDFHALAPAVYLLSVTDNERKLRIFQIVKY